MRSSILIVAALILLFLTSCQQELIYDPFESSEYGMSRYLSKIKETTYTTIFTDDKELSHEEKVSILFSNPSYDKNGRLENAYVNFIGQEANNTYNYGQDKITVYSRSRKDVNKLMEYTLDCGLITTCIEYSDDCDQKYYYTYSYNSDKCLNKINVRRGDVTSNIIINWHKGNIMSIKVLYEEGYSSIYSYDYSHNKDYRPIFPSFWISCFEIGGVYGVDEILSCNGYFGKSIPNDLITKEYYNGKLSGEFEYQLDGLGTITVVSCGKQKYSLEWR